MAQHDDDYARRFGDDSSDVEAARGGGGVADAACCPSGRKSAMVMRAPRHVLGSKVEILPPALDRFTRLPGQKHSASGNGGRAAVLETRLGERVEGCSAAR
jgi:hypothetical protein